MPPANKIAAMKELTALKRRDETLPEDDWPTYTLNHVTVHTRKNELIDLFEAIEHGPFTIYGKLQKPEKEFAGNVLKPAASLNKEQVMLENVGRWSIDDDLNIWALGKAGWFTLNPSAEYGVIFEQMKLKAAMWWWLKDHFEQGKRKVLSVQSMSSIFVSVAKRVDGLKTAEDAEAAFDQHHRFFIAKVWTDSNRKLFEGTIFWNSLIKAPKYKAALKDIKAAVLVEQKHSATPAVELEEELDELTIADTKATRSNKPILVEPQWEPLKRAPSSSSSSSSSQSENKRKRKYPDERLTRRTRSSVDSAEDLEQSQPDTPKHPKHSSKGTSVLRPSTRSHPSIPSSPLDKLELTGIDRPALAAKPVKLPNFILRDKYTVRKTRGLVKLYDERGHNIDDLRVQAIAKLSHLHNTYIASHKNWPKFYAQYRVEYDEVSKWREEHGLQPIYVDINHVNGHELGEHVLLERVDGTEYLIDTHQWDFETAQELLLNVNRGAYATEALKPAREGRKNIAKVDRNVTSLPAIASPACRRQLVAKSAMPTGSARAAPTVTWKCAGYDEAKIPCNFVVEDCAGREGSKAVSKHWQECAKRRHQSEDMIKKKQRVVVDAHNTLQEMKTTTGRGLPLQGVDNLMQWLEGEARKSVGWVAPEQF